MSPLRTRQAPPPFRRVTVARTEARTPYLVRVTLTGPGLEGFDPGLPAASVRLLLPPADGELVLPTWEGNEFLLPDGRRPAIRTLTPLRVDPATHELDVEVVLHDDSPLSRWVTTAARGSAAAVSGTGRGYDIDEAAPAFLLAGDESALPAITTLLPALPTTATVTAIVEIRHPDAALDLGEHPHQRVRWVELAEGAPPGAALVAAVADEAIEGHTVVWAAGEAAAVQRIRKHLHDDVGLPRSQTTVRGYWKHGRAGTGT